MLSLTSARKDVQKEETGQAKDREREEKRQKVLLSIRQRYGKDAILRGMNLEEGATAKIRNASIGGHKA